MTNRRIHAIRLAGAMSLAPLLPFYSLHFARHTLHAADAIPAAATNYYFSTPLRPDHLRGKVIGDPPAYYIPRSEDFDWLQEATMERIALKTRADGHPYNFGTNVVLRPEFGKWGMSATNRFHRWATAVDAAGVTNVVIGYGLVTNSPTSTGNPGPSFSVEPGWLPAMGDWSTGPGPDVSRIFFNPVAASDYRWGYLDPDVSIITNARILAAGVLPSSTNVYMVAGYTNAVTNSTSTILMPMTNGTVSVHENRWTAYRSYLALTAVTNVASLSPLDYCHIGEGAFPGFTNAPPLAGVQHVPVALSNSYVSLRGTTRLADPTLSPTNGPPASVDSYYYMGVLERSSTNAPPSFVGYTESYSVGGEHYNVLWDYDEETGTPVYEWFHTSEEHHAAPVQHGLTLPSRFISDVVTTGGVQRVTVEAAFALLSFQYSLDYRNEETDVYEQVADISKRVVVPIAAPEILDATDATTAHLTLTVDARSLLAAAAIASGAPPPPQSAAAFTPAQGYSEYWSADWASFILIYRTHPTSKFADW